ncbi:hypothetical protein [Streptomyces capitiformicae]|uniref:Uncharacterized protein n=1 Tax=Streptomyces capitiformicae TaxID=2014920 RepID=A0A918ZTU8_9ACTN|nr:hypothetical protein [Streptomyces capitiformicae]GHE70046.1 hypothetical protein GCM10017771_93970 [Streptomyces capitiformicae]
MLKDLVTDDLRERPVQGWFKSAARGIGIAAAGVAVLVGFAGPAHAAGGHYEASTRNGCGRAEGYYYYDYTAHKQGRAAYNTRWDFNVRRILTCGGTYSLYATYSKWTGTKWDYSHSTEYTRIGESGRGYNVADVMIYVCEIGKPSTCGRIHGV